MKKFLAILMAICMLASLLCVVTVPASAANSYRISLNALGKDGRIWAISVYRDFEEAWNEAIYYSTHLDEAWNSSERYESEADRIGEDGFEYVIVDLYGDWNADSNGSFGSGVGFKDGAIYIPDGVKIEVNLNGNTINRGGASGNAVYVDAGANLDIYNGSIVGNVYADANAKTSIRNIYVSGNAVNWNGSARAASIFGEGSPAMIVALLALASSVVSICLTVIYNKKKAVPAKNAKPEAEE